jgi:hypothetical protein
VERSLPRPAAATKFETQNPKEALHPNFPIPNRGSGKLKALRGARRFWAFVIQCANGSVGHQQHGAFPRASDTNDSGKRDRSAVINSKNARETPHGF